jgi:hypothetical protein
MKTIEQLTSAIAAAALAFACSTTVNAGDMTAGIPAANRVSVTMRQNRLLQWRAARIQRLARAAERDRSHAERVGTPEAAAASLETLNRLREAR